VTPREQRMSDLLDLLVAQPLGATRWSIASDLGCQVRAADRAIRDLRIFLGDVDDVNLVAESPGPHLPWEYRLVSGLDQSREWVTNRIGDTESRIRTMQAVMASAVTATDGRSSEGKRARIIERALIRLIEDLDEISV
jgi:hypothetical protein